MDDKRILLKFEKKVKRSLQRTVLYGLFLSVMCIAGYSKLDQNSYNYKQMLARNFQLNTPLSKYEKARFEFYLKVVRLIILKLDSFFKIIDSKDLWSWIQNDFSNSAKSQILYNRNKSNLNSFLNDCVSYVIGTISLKQTRVRSGKS